VAQEDLIADLLFFRELSEVEAHCIISASQWPVDFDLYWKLIEAGRDAGHRSRFIDPAAPALRHATTLIRRERPEISVEELAALLGVSPGNAADLLTRTAAS
jgi:hypothetical protein